MNPEKVVPNLNRRYGSLREHDICIYMIRMVELGVPNKGMRALQARELLESGN